MIGTYCGDHLLIGLNKENIEFLMRPISFDFVSDGFIENGMQFSINQI